MGRLNLFNDDGGGDSNGDVSKIEINQEFAKRYEHNKKREELQRYEELKKKGHIDDSNSDSDVSSSDDEKELNEGNKVFFDALIKIKTQDPVLRNKDAKLFDSDDESESGSESEEKGEKKKKKKKKKPMYLKDVNSKQLLEEGPEFDDEDVENGKNRVKSYSEEQEEFRRGLLEAMEEEENDEGGDLLTLKNDGSKENEDGDEDESVEKMEEYFGEDEKLDKDTKFLKDYFRHRMWANEESKKVVVNDEIEFSEDEEEIEKQEDYERGYNFRFEENAGDRVMGHSRKIEGSVRKKDNARKSQRERKEERIAQAEFEQKEELKRLKNLKKKEINEKLEKIKKVAGFGKDVDVLLDADDLEKEFDPEEYDRKMGAAFGDGYYKDEDVDPDFGSDEDEDGEKPDFDKEDDLLGLSKGWDEVEESGDGFLSARKRILKNKVDESDVSEDEDEEDKKGKRKRKRKTSEVEKAIRDELMEEYYKLDYEDTIGDLKTRFKYKPVKAKRYGLSPEEVLMMDDKDLNQYVSLKKLAPYVEKEWKVPRIKTVQLKQKAKEVFVKGETSDSVNKDKKKKKRDDDDVADEGENGESRAVKRRRGAAELKLSTSRLMAYGKIPSNKSKNKKQ